MKRDGRGTENRGGAGWNCYRNYIPTVQSYEKLLHRIIILTCSLWRWDKEKQWDMFIPLFGWWFGRFFCFYLRFLCSASSVHLCLCYILFIYDALNGFSRSLKIFNNQLAFTHNRTVHTTKYSHLFISAKCIISSFCATVNFLHCLNHCKKNDLYLTLLCFIHSFLPCTLKCWYYYFNYFLLHF